MVSKLHGMSRLRRKLHHMPEAVRDEVRPAMEDGAERIRDIARTLAPKGEGDLADAITPKVSRDGLSALVGFSRTKAGFKRAWKKAGWRAHFAEFGTHGSWRREGGTMGYNRGIRATPFLRPAFRVALPAILDRIDAAVDRALKRASRWGRG